MEKVIDLINDPVLPIRCFRCKTEESAVDLLNELSKLGYKWRSGHSLSYSCWRFFREFTCYILDVRNKCVTVLDYYESVEIFDYVFEYNSDCIKH